MRLVAAGQAMNWLDPATWKTPADLIAHWQVILAGIVVIGGAVMTIVKWGSEPARWLWSRVRGASEQDGPLHFVLDDARSFWSPSSDGTGTYIRGHWHVTNSSPHTVHVLRVSLPRYNAAL